MRSTDKNITPDIAAISTLSLQLSQQSLLFCIRNEEEILRYGTCDFNGQQSMVENLRRITEGTEELQLQYKAVYLIIDTEKACLVPSEFSAIGSAAAYMQANGINVAAGEQIACSRPVQNTVTWIVLQQEVLAYLQSLYRAAIRLLHPLQIALLKTHPHPTVEINLTNNLANITIKDVQLLYGDILPCTEPVNALFYLQQLNNLYDLHEYDILITGEGAQEVQKFIHPYYRHVTTDKGLRARVPKPMRTDILDYNNLIYSTDADY